MAVLVNIESFPHGWTNEQRKGGHQKVDNNVGPQNSQWAHIKPYSRANDWDDLEQFFMYGDVSIDDYDDIIYWLAFGIWDDGTPDFEPSAGNIAAVELKSFITEMSNEEAQAVIEADPVYWNERL